MINHRVIGGRHIIAGVSGGVWVDGGKSLAVAAAGRRNGDDAGEHAQGARLRPLRLPLPMRSAAARSLVVGLSRRRRETRSVSVSRRPCSVLGAARGIAVRWLRLARVEHLLEQLAAVPSQHDERDDRQRRSAPISVTSISVSRNMRPIVIAIEKSPR